MPPDSGVLGISESGGDEKDRRDGEERSGKLGDDDDDDDDDGDGDGDGDGGDGDGDGDRAGSGVEVDDRRRPKDVGDMANTPPLLPPIGSEDPDGGSPVPPLDGAPGMPPPLVPVADIGGDSSGSDDSDDGDRKDSRAGEHTVVLASEESDRRALVLGDGGEQSALAIEETGLLAIAGRAAAALADDEPEVPVGVFEACDIPEYEDGELIAFAGRFDAERNANKLLERLKRHDFDEDLLLEVLFVPDDRADRCPGAELVDDGLGDGDGIDLGVLGVPSDDSDGASRVGVPDPTLDSSDEREPEDGESATDEGADESTPADGVVPDLPGPSLPR